MFAATIHGVARFPVEGGPQVPALIRNNKQVKGLSLAADEQSNSREDIEKVAGGATATLIGSGVGKLIFFLTQLLISRWLGVEAFGCYALGIAVAKVFEIIARLGLNVGAMRFISIYRQENPQKVKGVAFLAIGLSALSGTFIGLVFYLSSEFIADSIFHKPELGETISLIAYSLPFSACMTVVSSMMQGFHTTKYTIYVRDLFQPITNILLTLGCMGFGLGLSWIIYAYNLSYIIGLVMAIYYFIKLFPQSLDRIITPIYEFRNLVVYSLPLLFVGFLHYLLTNTDTLMLGIFGTTSDAGVYRAASQLPLAMTVILFASNSIYAPLVADLHESREKERLANIFKATTKWISYIVVPIFIFIIFSSKSLMNMFGNEYIADGYIVLMLLSFGQLINCITGGVGFTLVMTGKQLLELYSEIVLVLVNISLNVILIPIYGVIGAAISSCISITSVNMLRTLLVYKILRIHPFSRYYITYLIKASVVIIVFGILQYVFHIAFTMLTYFIIISLLCIVNYMFSYKDEYDMIFISIVSNKLKRRSN